MADKTYNGAFTGAQIDEAIGKALNGTLMNAETYDPQGKATDIFKYVDEHASGGGGSGVHIGPEPPTNGETVWIDTDDTEGSFYTAKQVDELLAGKVSMELLWENASPTSKFEAQSTSFDYNGCKYGFVLFEESNDYLGRRRTELVEFTDGSGFVHILPNRANHIMRKFSFNNGIEWQNCECKEWNNSTITTMNHMLIPLKIIGWKEDVV